MEAETASSGRGACWFVVGAAANSEPADCSVGGCGPFVVEGAASSEGTVCSVGGRRCLWCLWCWKGCCSERSLCVVLGCSPFVVEVTVCSRRVLEVGGLVHGNHAFREV